MVKWLRSLFAWRIDHHAGVNRYEINTVTGKRRVRRYVSGGYSPIDYDWLKD